MDNSPLHPIYPHQYQYAAHSPAQGQRLMQHHRSRKDRDSGGQIGKYRRAGNAEPRQGAAPRQRLHSAQCREDESPEEVAEESRHRCHSGLCGLYKKNVILHPPMHIISTVFSTNCFSANSEEI